MATIDCVKCGSAVNSDAVACPQCGADPRTGEIVAAPRVVPASPYHTISCAYCGCDLQAGTPVCPQCGREPVSGRPPQLKEAEERAVGDFTPGRVLAAGRRLYLGNIGELLPPAVAFTVPACLLLLGIERVVSVVGAHALAAGLPVLPFEVGVVLIGLALVALLATPYSGGVQRMAIAALREGGPMRVGLVVPGVRLLGRYLSYWARWLYLAPLLVVATGYVRIGPFLLRGDPLEGPRHAVSWVYSLPLVAEGKRPGAAFDESSEMIKAISLPAAAYCLAVVWSLELGPPAVLLLVAPTAAVRLVAVVLFGAVLLPFSDCCRAAMFRSAEAATTPTTDGNVQTVAPLTQV